MRTVWFFSYIFIAFSVDSQSSFVGNYEGVFNGDHIVLHLMAGQAGSLKGTMQDSQNKYEVTGNVSKNTFTGTAIEPNLHITFGMKGSLVNNVLETVLTFDFLGEKHDMTVIFTKNTTDNSKQNANISPSIAMKTRDINVIGTWMKEHNYSSGYASNGSYGAMSSRESMVFYADGSMGDGGSTTTVGGSNFSGTTSRQQSGAIPGLFWWTDQNRIKLQITKDGASQEVDLGKYYIENGRMLITGANGEKLLLTKL